MSIKHQNTDKYDRVFFKVRTILERHDYQKLGDLIDRHIETRDIGILHTLLLSMHPDKENQYVNPKYNAVRAALKRQTNDTSY